FCMRLRPRFSRGRSRVLEPDEGKLSSPVLRGLAPSNGGGLLGKNAKKLTCESRFGAPVSFAFSGINRAVSALFLILRSPGLRDGACTIASLAQWVAQPAPRTVSYFIPSAMTGFIAYVFLYPSRVSSTEAFEALEPDDVKLSRPVLRAPNKTF